MTRGVGSFDLNDERRQVIFPFLYGVMLAFGLIIPLGMQNIFIFNQGATQKHFLQAMPSVLMAFICDAVLIILATLGVSVVVLTIPWLKTIIFIVGFFFLMYFGWQTWKNIPKKLNKDYKPLSAKKQIAFAASVSLLNPHALIDSFGIIGTNSLHFVGSAKIAFTLGCIIVSFCWFLGLSIAGHFLHRLDKTGIGLILVNKISALIMWGIAVYMGWNIFIIISQW